MTEVVIKSVLFLFLLVSLPINSYCQIRFDNAEKYAINDFENDLKQEFPDWAPSKVYPHKFTANLSGSNQEDLVVFLEDGNGFVGLGSVYVFQFDEDQFHMILKEKAFSVSAEIVSWRKHQGLLVGLAKFDDGVYNYSSDVLIYKNKEFLSVLQFPSQSCTQAGCWLQTQVLSSGTDQINIIEYRNDLKYAEGKPTCTKVTLHSYAWDEASCGFKSGEIKNLYKKDLDFILLKNNLRFPYPMRDVCDSVDAINVEESKPHKKKVLPATPSNL